MGNSRKVFDCCLPANVRPSTHTRPQTTKILHEHVQTVVACTQPSNAVLGYALHTLELLQRVHELWWPAAIVAQPLGVLVPRV